MNALLFGAQWVGLTLGVLLTGAFLLLLLAGPPQTGFMRIWEARVATSARWLALAALASGAAAMAAQTALFEDRLGAALDPDAI